MELVTMTKLMLLLFLSYFTRACNTIHVRGVKVPEIKQRGDSATLECEFELEGGRLYSVKWYRDNEEFYRYMPLLRPPQHSHDVDGVKVDLERSSERRVHLRELSLKSRGNYRCEVSEEAPSFHSDQAESFMEIYYFPHESPVISGHKRIYTEGEPLDVNCTSTKAFPAPDLQWKINGVKVYVRSWLTLHEVKPAAHGLLTTTLGLHAPAQHNMVLRCIASLGSHRRERTVVIETNKTHRWVTDQHLVLIQLCNILIMFCSRRTM